FAHRQTSLGPRLREGDALGLSSPRRRGPSVFRASSKHHWALAFARATPWALSSPRRRGPSVFQASANDTGPSPSRGRRLRLRRPRAGGDPVSFGHQQTTLGPRLREGDALVLSSPRRRGPSVFRASANVTGP